MKKVVFHYENAGAKDAILKVLNTYAPTQIYEVVGSKVVWHTTFENVDVEKIKAYVVEEKEAQERKEAQTKAYEIIFEMQLFIENYKFDRLAKNQVYDALYKMHDAIENM